MTPRVREILSYYGSEPPGVLANLSRLMNHGDLAGTGKMVILPVDQGYEHGPARAFAKVPAGYDPEYHVRLAVDSGCSAYAAPLGQLSVVARDYAPEIPLVLKLNNNDSLLSAKDPQSAITGSVKDAIRLGCVAIGYTIYPGTAARIEMVQGIRALIEEAREAGLPTILWSYARGQSLSKEGETGLDVIAYAAHIACQLGAHIIKVKPPTAHIEQAAAKKVYEEMKIPTKTVAERTRHVVESCFAGKRIVIFSGGESKTYEAVLEEVHGLAQGGAFGSIMGRNAFQRPRDEAMRLLKDVMAAFKVHGA